MIYKLIHFEILENKEKLQTNQNRNPLTRAIFSLFVYKTSCLWSDYKSDWDQIMKLSVSKSTQSVYSSSRQDNL